MRRSLFLLWAIGGIYISFNGTNCLAEENYNQGAVFSVIEENDLIVNTDRHYTQGIKLAYLHRDDYLPSFTSRLDSFLPDWGYDKKVSKVGYEIGQNIYTPSDTDAKFGIPNDRPYAGWLYVGLILQRRGLMADKIPTLESFQFEFGAIGPWSLAEDAQEWVHQVRGFHQPQGWEHQVHNEPGVLLKYQRSARFALIHLHPFDIDFIPHAGFSLGNVETAGRVGGDIRVGFNLPDDYGIQIMDSLITDGGGYSCCQETSRYGFYIFGGAEGKAVLHNAFLDGNLLRSSRSVDKDTLVADLKSGFVLVFNRFDLGFTLLYRTREFHTQKENDVFGSLALKTKF